MCQVFHMDNRPETRESWATSITASGYDIGEAVSDDEHEYIIDQLRTVMENRDISLWTDICVRVVEYYHRPGFPSAEIGTATCSPAVEENRQQIDEHTLVVSQWFIDRLRDPQVRDLLAHELVHLYVAERFSMAESRENSPTFEQALDGFDAPKMLAGEVVPHSRGDVWHAEHPDQ